VQVDYHLIRELLVYISESGYEQGAVLVFLPGWDDISRLRDLLQRDPNFGREDRFWVLPLHSGIPSKQQREVFKRPPAGVRKIVLATNIAETSITIDDVVFVVDSGMCPSIRLDLMKGGPKVAGVGGSASEGEGLRSLPEAVHATTYLDQQGQCPPAHG
jgi:HrpA-like RNA helicase